MATAGAGEAEGDGHRTRQRGGQAVYDTDAAPVLKDMLASTRPD